MTIFRTLSTVGAAVAMLGSTAAMAAPAVRSSEAMPSASVMAPVNTNVRQATPVKRKSHLAGGVILPAVLAGAIVIAGVIVAASGNSHNPVSPG